MRSILLYLSRNKRLESFILHFELARRAARRFIAGETMEEALEVVRGLNERGLLATIDHLGENVNSEAEALAAAEEYLKLLPRIDELGLRSHASLKLTQMGLDIGVGFCRENLERIVARAGELGNFVRIDMEGSAYTDRTLALFRELRKKHANVGLALQANLRRTERDLEELIPLGANVRLCKGAYKEPPSIAFPQKREVDANYIRLMEMLLSREARAKGAYAAIATHDERMIAKAKELAARAGLGPEEFEFQMLLGIRRRLAEELVREGYRVRIYVSYGTAWYPFYMRRLAERPANLLFILRNVFKR
ncbi:MAG: proline dehydrogenase family protein [Candidatus Acetothermia bacterium]|jgi:proline dehydrogenase|nr:proline dehydrogenase family protein [Candidatus Acetothermia bacterium]MDH7505825.1 proline dehydrogenase family protein [Candidatus Acetothermia bacterium]